MPHTSRAWVAEMDGEVIGIAGWYILPGGAAMAFSDMKDAMRNWPGTIMRESKRFMEMLPSPAVCIASNEEKNAARFLAYLGWEEFGESEHGKVYRWLQHH